MTQTRSVSWQDDKIKMAVYEPFPGVQVMKVSVRAPGFIEERRKSNRLEINFCVSGRFECEFTKRDIAILKPGDMAISLFDGENGINSYSRFPMDFYEGISILLDCDIAEEWLKEHLEVFDIHLQILRERLLEAHWYWAGEAGTRCEHVFRELYDSIAYEETAYIRLKPAELFLLLCRSVQPQRENGYLPGGQVELVKHIRDHMITDSEGYSSTEQLAREHGMTSAQLQKLFREIYGMPIYRYLKEYRLERAAVELINTSNPVMEVALNAGFTNASKFSEGFRKRYKMTPTAYRKQYNLNRKRDSSVKME